MCSHVLQSNQIESCRRHLSNFLKSYVIPTNLFLRSIEFNQDKIPVNHPKSRLGSPTNFLPKKQPKSKLVSNGYLFNRLPLV